MVDLGTLVSIEFGQQMEMHHQPVWLKWQVSRFSRNFSVRHSMSTRSMNATQDRDDQRFDVNSVAAILCRAVEQPHPRASDAEFEDLQFASLFFERALGAEMKAFPLVTPGSWDRRLLPITATVRAQRLQPDRCWRLRLPLDDCWPSRVEFSYQPSLWLY